MRTLTELVAILDRTEKLAKLYENQAYELEGLARVAEHAVNTFRRAASSAGVKALTIRDDLAVVTNDLERIVKSGIKRKNERDRKTK